MDNLDAAVEANKEGVKPSPHDHPGRAMCLNNLGTALQDRFEQTWSIDDMPPLLWLILGPRSKSIIPPISMLACFPKPASSASLTMPHSKWNPRVNLYPLKIPPNTSKTSNLQPPTSPAAMSHADLYDHVDESGSKLVEFIGKLGLVATGQLALRNV